MRAEGWKGDSELSDEKRVVRRGGDNCAGLE